MRRERRLLPGTRRTIARGLRTATPAFVSGRFEELAERRAVEAPELRPVELRGLSTSLSIVSSQVEVLRYLSRTREAGADEGVRPTLNANCAISVKLSDIAPSAT